MIYGARVRQARELRAVPQKQLAERMGISAGRLAQIEYVPAPVSVNNQALSALSQELRFPSSFFQQPLFEELADGSLLFRARRTLPQGVTKRARREAELAHEVVGMLLGKVTIPSVRVPDAAGADIERAAQLARASLGIPSQGPIPHVLRALERSGVFIHLIETRVEDKLDGFSVWTGPHLDRPVIAIGAGAVWDRQRHTAAHELGHLVLHRAPREEGVENEADRFASSFLFPAESALEELPDPVTLARLAPLKMRWGISIAALVMRAAELGVVDAKQKTSLMKQIAARGWRKREPGADARQPERPRATKKMLELTYGYPLDARRIAADLGWYPTDVVRLLRQYDDAGVSRSKRAAVVAPKASVVVLRRRTESR